MVSTKADSLDNVPAWLFDTRWYVEQTVTIDENFIAWVRAGAEGNIPAPLICRYLRRSLRLVLRGHRGYDDIISRITTATQCVVTLHMGIENGHGICRRAEITPPGEAGHLTRIPSIPIAGFAERYVREGLHRHKVSAPKQRRALTSVLLEQVAETYRQNPKRPVIAVAESYGIDPAKAARWVAVAREDGHLNNAPKRGAKGETSSVAAQPGPDEG